MTITTEKRPRELDPAPAPTGATVLVVDDPAYDFAKALAQPQWAAAFGADAPTIKLQSRVARREDGMVNVLDPFFGVKGDDSHDDTAGIQAAIDTGQAVYFPRPSVAYKITSPLLINRDDIRLLGAGRKFTPIKNYAASTPLIRSDNVQAQRFSFAAEALLFQNVNHNGIIANLTGVMFNTIHDCWMYAQGGNTSICLWLAGGRLGVNNYPTDGTYNYITHTYFGNCIRGVKVAEDGNQTVIDCCRVQPLAGGWGFEVAGTDINQPNSVMIRDCCVEYPGNVSNGIYADVCEDLVVTNFRAEALATVFFLTTNCRKPMILNPYADGCTTVLNDLGALQPCYVMPKEGIYAFPNLPGAAPSNSGRIWRDASAANVLKQT